MEESKEDEMIIYEDMSSRDTLSKSDSNISHEDNESLLNSQVQNVFHSVYNKPIPKEAQWKRGTMLILGDSMLHGIDES